MLGASNPLVPHVTGAILRPTIALVSERTKRLEHVVVRELLSLCDVHGGKDANSRLRANLPLLSAAVGRARVVHESCKGPVGGGVDKQIIDEREEVDRGLVGVVLDSSFPFCSIDDLPNVLLYQCSFLYPHASCETESFLLCEDHLALGVYLTLQPLVPTACSCTALACLALHEHRMVQIAHPAALVFPVVVGLELRFGRDRVLVLGAAPEVLVDELERGGMDVGLDDKRRACLRHLVVLPHIEHLLSCNSEFFCRPCTCLTPLDPVLQV
mmetsp:Transcript_24202/g.54407  ORF Transcript_24202/g.54407 Transcript_24202/m.54407 type:complete len:270 (+) Transcript_24202:53-862(+)